MVIYFLRLLNIESTHPGLKQLHQNGSFFVRLSEISFARQPIDIAVEVTINADAASPTTGISAFSHSISATTRWNVT